MQARSRSFPWLIAVRCISDTRSICFLLCCLKIFLLSPQVCFPNSRLLDRQTSLQAIISRCSPSPTLQSTTSTTTAIAEDNKQALILKRTAMMIRGSPPTPLPQSPIATSLCYRPRHPLFMKHRTTPRCWLLVCIRQEMLLLMCWGLPNNATRTVEPESEVGPEAIEVIKGFACKVMGP